MVLGSRAAGWSILETRPEMISSNLAWLWMRARTPHWSMAPGCGPQGISTFAIGVPPSCGGSVSACATGQREPPLGQGLAHPVTGRRAPEA